MSLTTIQVLPSSVPGLRRTLAREEDGTLVEVVEGAGARAANLPQGGLFPPVRSEEGDRVLLGAPLARSLAALQPPPLAALAFAERLLLDLETLRAGGGAHGAIHPDGWGADAGGTLRVRAVLHFPAPTGHPWTADLAAVGSGLRGLVDLAQAEALGVVHMRVWARAMGMAGERVSFQDARAARQALAAALARVDANGALGAWMKEVGVRLPGVPKAFDAAPVARAPANPDPERSARAWVEREIAQYRAERYLELRRDVERRIVADRLDAERSTREIEARRTHAAEVRENAHAAVLEQRRERDLRAREETLARLASTEVEVLRLTPPPPMVSGPPAVSQTAPDPQVAARVRIGGGSNDLRIRAMPSLASTLTAGAGNTPPPSEVAPTVTAPTITLPPAPPAEVAPSAPAPMITAPAITLPPAPPAEVAPAATAPAITLPPAPPAEVAPAATAPAITLPPAPPAEVAPAVTAPAITLPPASPAEVAPAATAPMITAPAITLPPAPPAEFALSATAPAIALPPAPPSEVAPAATAPTITLPPAPPAEVTPAATAPAIALPPAPPSEVAPAATAPTITLPPAPPAEVAPAATAPAITLPTGPAPRMVVAAPPPSSVLPLPIPERDTTVTLRVPPPAAAPGEALRRGTPPRLAPSGASSGERGEDAYAAGGAAPGAASTGPRPSPQKKDVHPDEDRPTWAGTAPARSDSHRQDERGAGKWADAPAARPPRAPLDLDAPPPETDRPSWSGIQGVTGTSDRMYEKGAGKWGDAQARPELRDMMRGMDREERGDLDLRPPPPSAAVPLAVGVGVAATVLAALAWWMA